MNDLRFAFRQLRKNPGFTAVAALTLGLGIGANTAIFSVFKAVILEPFPYPDAHRLVHIWETDVSGRWHNPLSAPDYYDVRDQSRSFEEIGVYDPYGFNVGAGEPVRVAGILCSASALRVFGVAPALGRLFTDEEESDGSRPVVLAHSLWRGQFQGASNIVGQAVSINGETHRVVAVMPAGFEFLSAWSPGQSYALWTPYPLQGGPGKLQRDEKLREDHWMLTVGRLKAGVTHWAAEAELKAIAARISQAQPKSHGRTTMWVMPFMAATVGGAVGKLLVLMATVGFVLLAACANVACLLLAKGASRLTEVAVRVSLGASKRRIVGQMLSESLLLAALGVVLGVLLARWGLSALEGVLPADLPRRSGIQIDVGVLIFAFGLTVVTTLLFGLAPALVAARTNVVNVLKEGATSQGGARTRNRLLRYLAVAQIAIALLVTNQAFLLIESLRSVLDRPHVFDTRHVLTAGLQLEGGRYDDAAQRTAFWEQLLARIEALPRVERAAVTTQLPLRCGGSCVYRLESEMPDERTMRRHAWRTYISPGYFEAMGISLLAGRTVQRGDERLPEQGVVVNRALADLCWPKVNPVGQRLFDASASHAWSATVVGVVESTCQNQPGKPPEPEIYWLYDTNPWPGSKLVVRGRGDPKELVATLRGAVAELDPLVPLWEIQTMKEVLIQTTQGRRFVTMLSSLFAGLILVLVMTAVYGLISYQVSQRTREIGIRVALGAGRLEIARLIVGQTFGVSTVGVLLGAAAAVNLAFLTRSVLFGTSPMSLLHSVLGTLLVLAVSVGAALMPTRRATRVDPVQALRYE